MAFLKKLPSRYFEKRTPIDILEIIILPTVFNKFNPKNVRSTKASQFLK